MSSVTSVGLRQVSRDGGYYMPLSTLAGQIQSYNATTGFISSATWASTGGAGVGLINGPFKSLLRDQGKTVVSSGRTFRKIQVVGNNVAGQSTFGVLGPASTGVPNTDYFTGYIEVGVDGASGAQPLPVAVFGR
jgi:hypothetical protein